MSGLRDAILRRWEWLWRRDRREEHLDRTDNRARFWSEFREGQREADERSSRNTPRADRRD
jgi:hypothetical protein